jgi:hypothetical protein
VELVEGEIIEAATCKAEGLRHMDCPYCNEHIRTEAIPVDENAHKITWSTVDTSCDQCSEDNGYSSCTIFMAGEHGVCDLCGQHFAGSDGSYEVHDWSNLDGICARCSTKCEHEEGYNEATCCSYKTCKTCGLAEGEYDENTHDPDLFQHFTDYKDPSTCKVYKYWDYCFGCQHSEYSTDWYLDHTWDSTTGKCTDCGADCEHDDDYNTCRNGTVVEEATCSSLQLVEYTCSICGQTKTESEGEPDENNHANLVTERNYKDPATCIVYDYYDHCDCGYEYYSSDNSGVGEHNWDSSTGQCTDCGADCEHDDDYNYLRNGTEVEKATCEYPSVVEYTCSICGKTTRESEGEPLGHSYTDGICTNCSEIDPDYEWGTSETDCSHPNIKPMNGGEWYLCPDCGYNYG